MTLDNSTALFFQHPNHRLLPPMPSIQPSVLVWARESAGLSQDTAAEKLGIHAAQGASAAERLQAFETGQREPSRPLLLKMAKAYRRSLLTFYLSTPPPKGDRGQDFRTLPQQQTTAEPLVDALVRDIRTRQSLVRSAMEEDSDASPLRFVGSKSIGDGVSAVVRSLQETLSFDIAAFRKQGNVEAGFSYLRTKIEALGVFVLLIGNLGSHHTDLEVSAFRGFALADPIAPFVVINDHDAKSAWSFTLLHELVHLWLGATGISGPFGESQLERFCNDVASTLLITADELRDLDLSGPLDNATMAQRISAFAGPRLVSHSMIAYRLFRAGRISEQIWTNLSATFRQQWLANQQAQRERSRARASSGPSYYVVRRHRLGLGLLTFVEQSISEGLLTHTKASMVLGVKPRSVAPLLSTIHRGAS